MTAQKMGIVSKLTVELDAALALLREFKQVADPRNPEKPLASPLTLLDQCMALCAEHISVQPEPVRTVHHFACTGGTLISKCIASMPNTQLLSEVDPFNTPVEVPAKPQFAPSDMVTLMRQSTRGTSREMIAELFLNNLEVIHRLTMDTGLRLILRDHAHSHFCRGNEVQDRPDLRTLVSSKFPVMSLVTVRDPIDSYLSLKANGWVHFTPATFDEYCRRYMAFIQAYEGVPIVRYEDFVSEPENEMMRICQLLDLSFNPDFRDLFNVHRLSGDSGRTGMSIEPRPRRAIDASLAREFETSVNYRNLRLVLGYERESK